MKAIRVASFGGPEVLEVRAIPAPSPPPGHVLVRIRATGVNFIEIYQRTGLYPVQLPWTPGGEGAGEVEAVGSGVKKLRVGDRVASVQMLGSYAEVAVVPEERAVVVPDGVDLESTAAALLQGMTAHYLVYSTFPLRQGQSCLVHAAAGGVGLLLTQLAKRRGARVLGTVGTDEKARLAREAGADEVIVYTREDFVARVREATGGRGVDVVYDSVGLATFDKSLDCLAPLGMLALFGQSSGVVAPINPSVLAQKGSLFLTRPVLFHYVAEHARLEWRANEILGLVKDGGLKLRIGRRYPLAGASEAHRALAARETTGKLLLLPDQGA